MAKVRKAVFPVAGMGTRFLPATKAMAKEMLTIVDKPLIQYVIEEAAAAGIEEFILVTARHKGEIEDHFDRSVELEGALEDSRKRRERAAVEEMVLKPGQIAYIRQQEPLGLGHAVWCARYAVGDEPFAVLLPDEIMLADEPVLAQLLTAHAEVGGNVVAVMEVPRERTARYGILDVEEDRGRLVRVRGLVEKPEPDAAPSTLSLAGRYVLDPQVMDALGRQEAGRGGEIQLTDAIAATIGTIPLHGVRFEGRRFDCGNPLGFLEANIAYALGRADLADDVQDMLRRYAGVAAPAGT